MRPQQLGPVTHSTLAIQMGLGVSILEKYMALPLYCKTNGKYNQQYISKLLRCYRCHPDIIKIPNELFYDDELIDHSGDRARGLTSWKHLVTQNVPMIFHNVSGDNIREENSPSWFNIEEIN